MEDMAATLKAGSSVQTVYAARRVGQEVPPGTPPMEVLAKFGQFVHENAVSQGLQWPSITPEQMYAAGVDWHLFPNQVMLMGPTGLLGYRARPLGRSEEHTSELQSLMRISYAVFCLKKKKNTPKTKHKLNHRSVYIHQTHNIYTQ